MTYLDMFRRKVRRKGETFGERFLSSSRRTADKGLRDSPNRWEVQLYDRAYDEIIDIYCVIDDIREHDDRQTDDKKGMFSLDTTIDVGYTIDWETQKYLVIINEQMGVPSHKSVRMRPCNFCVKFVGKDKLQHEYWSVVRNMTLYSDGLRQADFIQIPEQKLHLMLPMNDVTKHISRGDRLVLFDDTYSITNIDRTKLGLIQFILSEVPIQEVNDDMDNSLADADLVKTYTISFAVGTYIEQAVNETFALNAIATDNDGNIADVADFTYASTNTDVASVDSNGNVTVISEGTATIIANFADVSSSITVVGTATPVLADVISIQAPTTMRELNTEIVSTEVFENGKIQVSANPTIEILDENDINIGDGTDTSIAQIVDRDGNLITIRANKGFVGQSFKVKATYNASSTEFEITIKSIFS